MTTSIVGADKIVLQEIVVGAVVVEEYTVAYISRNYVALCVGISAYAVAERTVVEKNTISIANR
jgi:hypothetical protein